MQKRPTRRSRRSNNWSSSVVGSHQPTARGSSPYGSHSASQYSRNAGYDSRRRKTSLRGRAGEVTQIRHAQGTGHRRSSSPGELLRKNRRNVLIGTIIAIVIVVVAAFNLGSCAFQASIGSNMALKDSSVSSKLVTANENDPYYILLVGLTEDDQKASYISVLRVDPTNKRFTLLNVPDNISVSSSTMLRDLPGKSGQGQLVSEVSSLIGCDIAHYVAFEQNTLSSLVDKLGGLTLTVDLRVDDPRYGTVVLDPGEQTLNGEQALMYVSAYNYTDGRTTRAEHQKQVLQAVINKMCSLSGTDFMNVADTLSQGLQTDLSYDQLSALSELYKANGELTFGTIPGTDYESGDQTYFRITTSEASSVYQKFKDGQDYSSGIDTSSVDKSGISIIVLNGTSITGSAAKVKDVLESKGYTVKETGNATQAVYDETLVIYRDSSDQTAAEAIVADLGVGRAVAAGVHYTLTTNIQVMVGKDWVS